MQNHRIDLVYHGDDSKQEDFSLCPFLKNQNEVRVLRCSENRSNHHRVDSKMC